MLHALVIYVTSMLSSKISQKRVLEPLGIFQCSGNFLGLHCEEIEL